MSKPIIKHAPLKLKLRRLTIFVFPVILYRFARWPFTSTLAGRIDRVHRSMISTCARIQMSAHETPCAYKRRKGKLAASIQREAGVWSEIWRERVVSWAGHLERNTASHSWTARLMNLMPPSELQHRRAHNSNRPVVRKSPGYINSRWQESTELLRVLS